MINLPPMYPLDCELSMNDISSWLDAWVDQLPHRRTWSIQRRYSSEEHDEYYLITLTCYEHKIEVGRKSPADAFRIATHLISVLITTLQIERSEK